MPEPQEYSIFRNWPLVRKALSIYESRDWWDEYETIINLIDADMNALFTETAPLPVKEFTTSTDGTGNLLYSDSERVMVTGSALNYTVKLPDATSTPQVGKTYRIYNGSSAPIHVVSYSSSNVVTTLNPGQVLHATLAVHSEDGTWAVGRFTISEAITKEPTGFVSPEDVIVTYSSDNGTITLTGTVEAYYNGKRIIELVPGWESAAHDADPDTLLFLYHNGDAFVWDRSIPTFDSLWIAYVFYDTGGTFQFALRETHGLQPWETHENLHETIGTYRVSGGDLGGYVLDSTTPVDRRPTVSGTDIQDEDLRSVIAAHTSGNDYTQLYLSGADGDVDLTAAQDDIVDIAETTPLWNEYTGGVWTKTALGNNDYMSLWLMVMPTAADSKSQALRFVWVAGQSSSTTLLVQRALSPASLNLTGLDPLTPEFVFIEQVIIIKEPGADNWKIVEVRKLTGTKASTVSTATGGFLSAVSTDETLSGIGTASDPLTSRIAPTDVAVAAYIVLATDSILNVDAGEACEITILSAEISKSGWRLIIKDAGRDSALYAITIETEGAETIEGHANAKINLNGMALSLFSDGSNLHIE